MRLLKLVSLFATWNLSDLLVASFGGMIGMRRCSKKEKMFHAAIKWKEKYFSA